MEPLGSNPRMMSVSVQSFLRVVGKSLALAHVTVSVPVPVLGALFDVESLASFVSPHPLIDDRACSIDGSTVQRGRRLDRTAISLTYITTAACDSSNCMRGAHDTTDTTS